MGIVILRSMGGQPLNEEQMKEINLAECAEIRRIVNRSCRRGEEAREAAPLLSVQASAGVPLSENAARAAADKMRASMQQNEDGVS